MLAAYDCFGDADFSNLSHLAKRLLGKQIKRYKDIVQEGETFLDIPFSELVEHACSDADTAFQLYQKLTGEMKKRQILDTFFNQTMAVMAKLAMMEFSGISIDVPKMNRHMNAISKKAEDLKNKIYSGAGFEFELETLKSIGEGLKKQEWYRENFGMSQISSAAIEQLASRHPLIGAIAEYRRLRRRITEGNEIISNASDGKAFPSFNQIRESCGKISSSDPRLDEAIIAGAVADKTLCGNWFDSERAITQLSILTEDPVLQKDLKDQERTNFLKTDSIVAGLPNVALLQSLVINPSGEALCKQFLVSRNHSYKIRRELESRYAIVFRSLDILRKDVLEKGYVGHGGQRKYFEGLHSSDLNKRNKALVAAVRWRISH
jgi:DNA polymerase I-like protein with 3'-5' exonuclease and polymerase domains